MSNISTLGFNGEYLDDTLDSYHLGNGYRAYNPTTMQFSAPDDMSPFGRGGVNPYMYVSCDPINNTDPTGHFNVLTFATGAFTLGFSLVSAGAAIASVFDSGGATSLSALGVIAGSVYGMYAGIDQIVSSFKQSSDITGEQWKNFGINLGITVAAEFGGALLGAGIKALAPETSASIRGVSNNIEPAVRMSSLAADEAPALNAPLLNVPERAQLNLERLGNEFTSELRYARAKYPRADPEIIHDVVQMTRHPHEIFPQFPQYYHRDVVEGIDSRMPMLGVDRSNGEITVVNSFLHLQSDNAADILRNRPWHPPLIRRFQPPTLIQSTNSTILSMAGLTSRDGVHYL